MWSLSGYSVQTERLYKSRLEQDISKIIERPVTVSFSYPTKYRMTCHVTSKGRYGDDPVAGFNLECFPGTCGIMISDHSYVCYPFKRMGVGTLLMNYKIEISKNTHFNFSQLMCVTVDEENEESYAAEHHLLRKFGFEVVRTFVNERGGNTCHVWMLGIQ